MKKIFFKNCSETKIKSDVGEGGLILLSFIHGPLIIFKWHEAVLYSINNSLEKGRRLLHRKENES